jgi:hypothetical protein
MKPFSSSCHGRGVEQFLTQHEADVTGVISGFDRLRLRASLRWLYQPSFMKRYLCEAGVLLKDFGAYATGLSNRIRAAAHAFAGRERRPVRYLHSTALNKEELARTLAERDQVREGLIGLFDIVEPCLTYFVRGDRAAHQLHLELRPGKCLHHYFYFQHAQFGLMHLRVQSWFPFQVTVCLNGRLWLGKQLNRAGVGYLQRDNAFVAIDDVARAQRLADAQARAPLVPAMERLLREWLLRTTARGKWAVNGFRNRDLRAALYKPSRDPAECRRQSGHVTRLLALLRAHGLIRKVTGTHRYIITARGRQLTTTLLAAQQGSVEQLIKLAA